MFTAQQSPFLRPQVLAFAFVSLTLLYFITPSTTRVSNQWDASLEEPVAEVPLGKCSPADWSAGAWRRKENAMRVTKSEDVYAVSGFSGCASRHEDGFNLAGDQPDYFAWRGNVSAYEWIPPHNCDDVLDDYRESLVVDLVEKGGWLLIGDSVTEQQFFSMSCALYPHVIATPDATKIWDWDRAWPEHLLLNPDSPLVSRIKFPNGFNISQTPLVTFRRNDVLFNLTEIETMFNGGGWRPGPGEKTNLFGEEASWTISVSDYLGDLFFRPLPEGNYHTLVLNTGAHWCFGLFSGLPHPFTDVIELFRVVMTNLVYQAARQLDLHQSDGKQREIVVRDYLVGYDNCHAQETMFGGPLKEVPDLKSDEFWARIPIMNALLKKVVEDRAHPQVNFLGIDRPGRLRPDAHVLGDCLHVTVGAGIVEGWTRYLHYYLGTYLPWHRQESKSEVRSIPGKFRR
ncbi:hypothetical protein FS837_001632 [Tulasnella sp. UAMH 9824]|nr:hypothetical protein FS837_001632 [Tulasnella sp. UAMH 9824]